jgi:hypothetical protein
MSAGRVLKLVDSDDGATGVDIVRVPEGWSLQMYDLGDTTGDYRSVIINVDQMRELQAHFLATETMR